VGRSYAWLAVVVLAGLVVARLFPGRGQVMLSSSAANLVTMLTILPAVVLLMGLFAVWVPRSTVVRHLGKASGVRGVALALLFGALPTGPLYIAFPIAGALLARGARLLNVIVFLSAWGCIKLPQEIVEYRFLGLRFMLLRLVFTVASVVVIGSVIEGLVGRMGGASRASGRAVSEEGV